MPIVSSGWIATFSLVDTGGNTATKLYNLQAADYAAALVDVAAVEAALDPITTATIKGYNLTEKFLDDAFTYPTLAEVENQAEIVVRLASVNKFDTIYIPAPIASIFVGATGEQFNTVDGTDPLVAAYLALFNAGASAYLSDGETITPAVAQRFKSGKRIHKASRKG